VRGDGLAATMSRYLVDRIENARNVALLSETGGQRGATFAAPAGRRTHDAIASVYGDAPGSATPCLTLGGSRSGAHSTGSGSRSCPGAR
jgi:hypothetical protein